MMNELEITVTHDADQTTPFVGDVVRITYREQTIDIRAHDQGGFLVRGAWGTLVVRPEASNAVHVVEEDW
jgi:hypothetical protein